MASNTRVGAVFDLLNALEARGSTPLRIVEDDLRAAWKLRDMTPTLNGFVSSLAIAPT
jgi:hypothetical protein